MATQLLTPSPNIPCTPGYCLQYVREAYGIYPGVYPTATSGWLNSPTQHRDTNFPEGVWVPLWFGIASVPAGHVVLRAPDGRIWSTTNAGQYTPRIHPDLDDLMGVYARAGLPLTYRGWTEDIETVTVVDAGSLSYAGEIITPQEDELSAAEVNQIIAHIDARFDNIATEGVLGQRNAGPLFELSQDIDDIEAALTPGESGVRHAGAVFAALDALKGNTATLDPAQLAAAIKASLPVDLAKQVVAELGTALGGH